MNKTSEKRKRAKAQQYDESFKRAVCEEYLRIGGSKVSLLRKYKISFRSAIQTWLKELGYVTKERQENQLAETSQLSAEGLTIVQAEASCLENQGLQAENARLREALRLVELKNELYAEMIRLAEAEWGLNLEKKSVTKPSKI